MTVRRFGIAAAAGLLLLQGEPASAADAPMPSLAATAPVGATGPDWAVAVHSYAWATSVDGTMRPLPPGPAVKVGLGFSDILKNLDGAAMLSLDARRDRFVIFADLLMSKLSAGKTFSAQGLPGSITLSSSSVVGLVAAGWRVVDEPAVKLDVLGGLRGFALSNTIAVAVGPRAGAYGLDRQWLDAVGGARITRALDDRWSLTAMGFAGAGGAKYEWDLFGGVGYRFGGRFTGFAGYRAFKVDYRQGSYVYDVLQHGPILGTRLTF